MFDARTQPRAGGKCIKGEDGKDEESFVELQAQRVSRETRKVLRLAAWDLKERFGTAMEKSAQEVKGAQELENKATRAKAWFTEVQTRTGEVRLQGGLVESA